jgi:hypothetical protein
MKCHPTMNQETLQEMTMTCEEIEFQSHPKLSNNVNFFIHVSSSKYIRSFLGHGPRSTWNCARKLFHEQLGLQSDPFNAEESYPGLCRSAYTILDNLMYQVHIVV